MICTKCKKEMQKNQYFYKCNDCGFEINKYILKHEISQEDIDNLLTNGETGELEFVSKNTGKSFFEKLVIKDNKAVFKFTLKPSSSDTNTAVEEKFDYKSITPHDIPSAIQDQTEAPSPNLNNRHIDLYINSLNIGQVHYLIHINKKNKIISNINFGAISSRESQCLACITAIDYINFHNTSNDPYSLSIISDNDEFVKYVLSELKPKDTHIRKCVEQLRDKLNLIDIWSIKYLNPGRQRIQGGNTKEIPPGIFPWFDEIKIGTDEKNRLVVNLPNNYAVIGHFQAIFPLAQAIKKDSNILLLDVESKEKVEVWYKKISQEE